MGIVNARNLRKAKQLLEKNRHKVGDAVGKATTKLDKVSGGKTANLSAKAEEAARKYSAGGATHHGVHPDAVSDGQMQQAPNATDAAARQGEANVAAANAMKSAAEAATKLFNKAAAAGGATGSDGLPPPPAAGTATDAPPPPLDGPPPLPEP